MNIKEQVIAAAEELLAAHPAGLTGEALTGLVAKRIRQQIPLKRVTDILRERPQRFVEGEGGRWQLRTPEPLLVFDEPAASDASSASPFPAGEPAHQLKRGCYVVFDLEATRPDAYSPATEIIQIAAQRW